MQPIRLFRIFVELNPLPMNRLNRIFHNKQIKLFWFLRSFARYLTPKRLLQFRLDRVLAEAERRPDWF